MTEVTIRLEFIENYKDPEELRDVVYWYLKELIEDNSLNFSVENSREQEEEEIVGHPV
jgi:hypothetical protein